MYPDELVYSIISRIHQRAGDKRSIMRIFGRNQICNPLMTIRLQKLAEFLGVTGEELVEKHSLYPYYSKFILYERKIKLRNYLLFGDAKSSIIRLNISKWSRLCPMCMKNDINKYGEPYWHRAHHLPGTEVCCVHNVQLISECPICDETISPLTIGELKIAPTHCNNGHSLYQVAKNTIPQFYTLARENSFLLVTDYEFSLVDVQSRIMLHTLNRGYRDINSPKNDYDLMFPDFLKVFPKDVLNSLNLSSENSTNIWLKAVFRKQGKSPLHYLLVMLFFEPTVDQFLTRKLPSFW